MNEVNLDIILEVADGLHGPPDQVAWVVSSKACLKILHFLRISEEPKTTNQIRDYTGVPYNTVYNILKHLEEIRLTESYPTKPWEKRRGRRNFTWALHLRGARQAN